MSGIANYAENQLLNTLRNVSFAVAAVWVRLHTGDPGEDATSNLATESTRQSVTFSAASSGQITSSSTLTWSNVAATETITHVSLWDASTGGNALWKGALTASRALTAGDNFTISSGSLTVSLD